MYDMYSSFHWVSETCLTSNVLADVAQDSAEVCTRRLADVMVLPASDDRSNIRKVVSEPVKSERKAVLEPPATDEAATDEVYVSRMGVSVTVPVAPGWVA